MFQRTPAQQEEAIERAAAASYTFDNLGLMKAIKKSDIPGIRGLVKYHQHDVNAYIMGGLKEMEYQHTPTPLALAIRIGNVDVIKELIALGADKNHAAQHYIKQDTSPDIRELFTTELNTRPAPSGY